jgi:hypothetical protein
MKTTWFLVNYKWRWRGLRRVWACAMEDYTKQIAAQRGNWSETGAIVGEQVVVKAQAAEELLVKLEQTFERLPLLEKPVRDLGENEMGVLLELLTRLEISQEEISRVSGDNRMLGDVLELIVRN